MHHVRRTRPSTIVVPISSAALLVALSLGLPASDRG